MPKHAVTVAIVAVGLVAAVVIVRSLPAPAEPTPGRASGIGVDAARSIAVGLTPKPVANAAMVARLIGRGPVATSTPFRGIA